MSRWSRPTELARLRDHVGSLTTDEQTAWDAVVARCRAADTVARLRRTTVDGALVVDASTDAAADTWPADFLEAWARLGHEERYGKETAAGLTGLFQHLSDEQLEGLTNSVKGTLMEIRVRDMIQAGEVPGVGESGAEAYLSPSLTQTGHDVEIVDDEGAVIEAVQVKAGGWADVRDRVDEYASDGIPVVVTSETAEKAVAAGYADVVIDSGIDGRELAEQTASIVDNLGLGHAVDELLPELAMVALMAAAGLRLREGQSPTEVRRWLTKELTDTGVANAAGVAVQLITGLAVVRPLAVLGTRWGIARARTAAEAAVVLRRGRETLASIAASSSPPQFSS